MKANTVNGTSTTNHADNGAQVFLGEGEPAHELPEEQSNSNMWGHLAEPVDASSAPHAPTVSDADESRSPATGDPTAPLSGAPTPAEGAANAEAKSGATLLAEAKIAKKRWAAELTEAEALPADTDDERKVRTATIRAARVAVRKADVALAKAQLEAQQEADAERRRKESFAEWAAQESANAKQHAKGPSEYLVRPTGTWFIEDGRETQLANFSLVIDEEVTSDDGVEKQLLFRMKGKSLTQASTVMDLPEVEVPAKEFCDMKWVVEKLGAGAIIAAGAGARDHVRAAIQRLSDPKKSTVYAHTGWRNVGGDNVYLS